MQKLEFDKTVKEKLKECINQELKYSELCKKIGIQAKSGASKRAQLNDLASYCDIIKLSKPTRYVIKEVYDVAFEVINKIASNDKYQMIFDGILFQALLNNNQYPLYVSGLELIEMFQEVNKNFAITFSSSDMAKIGSDYQYMSEMSEVVYRVLYQWTCRKIESMNKRGVIRLSSGYRVYSEYKGFDGKTYLRKYDIPQSTSEKINEFDIMCNKIYLDTKNRILPQRKIIDENGKEKLNSFYPSYKLAEFDMALGKEIHKATDGKYCKMKKVNIILPPYNEWMIEKLKEIYSEIPNFKEINEEACRKILETTQLDKYTNEERKKFVLFNMSNNPPFMFKNKLKEIEEND